jgi:replicative DNA helicase
VVKDRPSAVAFLKGMGMNAVTADALASVIQAKKPEPAAKDRPKKSEAPSGTPLTPEKIQKTYGLDPNQSKVVAADAEEQVVSAAAGSGKCLGLGTPVMLFDGRVIAVENVKVGDRLMGPDSKPRVVQSVTQGKGMLYQITPVKGDPWVCNDVHVLTLAGTNRRNGQIRDIPLNEFQKLGKNERQKDWKLFRVGVEYKARPTPIDPYFLGLWIGDGTTTASVITNMEPEIREFCAEYAERLGMFCEQTYVPRVNAWTIAFTAKKGRKSPAAPNHLRQYLRLCCCARNNAKRKIIPEKFMVNSREVRLQLLAGIIDTDGYYHRGCYESRYDHTRHNVGFQILESIAHQHAARWSEKTKLKAQIAEISVDGEKILLVHTRL